MQPLRPTPDHPRESCAEPLRRLLARLTCALHRNNNSGTPSRLSVCPGDGRFETALKRLDLHTNRRFGHAPPPRDERVHPQVHCFDGPGTQNSRGNIRRLRPRSCASSASRQLAGTAGLVLGCNWQAYSRSCEPQPGRPSIVCRCCAAYPVSDQTAVLTRILIAARRRRVQRRSAAGSGMVGPPSSWSLQDQEDLSWQAGRDGTHIALCCSPMLSSQSV